MDFDISRDFLDGIMLQHPPTKDGQAEVTANANLQFLPSSPDKTMHTAVVTIRIGLNGVEQAFAQGGWRFLYTTSEAFEPQEGQASPFLQRMLVAGASKILAVLNPLCLHANMPLIPLDANSLIRGLQEQAAQQQDGNADSGE